MIHCDSTALKSTLSMDNILPSTEIMSTEHTEIEPFIRIHRSAYTLKDIDELFEVCHVDLTVYGRAKRYLLQITKNPQEYMLKCLMARIPCLQWMAEYDVRKSLLNDIVSGITVGIFNIPQGMAYGLLCNLPAVYGLYTSFYPPVFYAFFGSSRHIAIGTFSVVSLMSSNTVSRYAAEPCESTLPVSNGTASPTDWFCTSNAPSCSVDIVVAVQVATVLTFLVGIFQVAFGIFHMGFLSVYLSDQLVEGLTTGSAVLVLTSQVPSLFGHRNLPRTGNPLDVIKFYGCFFQRISKTNFVSLLISAMGVAALVIVKSYLSPIWKRYLKVPLPAEIFLVMIATAVSYGMDLNSKYNVSIVGNIPQGLYAPAVPKFSMMANLIPDAATIAIVSYAISLSLAKLFAKKHGYRLMPNQEWFAYGLVSILSSFFGCHPICASLSRSLIQNSQGATSQIAGVVGGLVVMVFLLFLAPFLECLPKCVLASIIVTALTGMFQQVRHLPHLWNCSKPDFFIWIFSCAMVVLLDIKFGLIASIIFALLTVIFRSQWPYSFCLGRLGGSEIYRGLNAYKQIQEIEGIKIYRFDCPLFFANVELFKDGVRECTGIDPILESRALRKRKWTKEERRGYDLETRRSDKELRNHFCGETKLHTIVIDCSSFSYIDLMGVEAMKQIYVEYKAIGIDVAFAACKVSVRQLLKRADTWTTIPSSNFHPSVHDSIICAIFKNKTATNRQSRC